MIILYSIILVEDDSMQREVLKIMILSTYNFIKIYEADSESTALDIIKNNDINMFLIDISLKDSSGLELAMKIRNMTKYEFTQLIFLTTHVDYMLQAFKQTHCYDYILKPYDKHEVQAMLNKLINKDIYDLNNENNELDKVEDKEFVIKIRNGIFVRVKIRNILFIEVNGRNCEVNTFDGIYTYGNISLKKILQLINCDYIVQSHKSFAVNKNYIFKMEKLDLRLSTIYFKDYSKTALLGYKFKKNIVLEFKEVGKYYVK
ncbi:LytR/AlgR family response regulator transcription factor [Clostridium saccharobutylicum]|uniref:LytR/AlgR family response regulator transcription factor n=1 Tax=Clostridium saccharobutylicum TaxID=169679 RepID=UPI001FA8392C|nr:LytTR family DNA-binding domain-containing protein [Clostridium saccharobutylicum]